MKADDKQGGKPGLYDRRRKLSYHVTTSAGSPMWHAMACSEALRCACERRPKESQSRWVWEGRPDTTMTRIPAIHCPSLSLPLPRGVG